MHRKKTHEEYVSELAIKNPNVKAIDTYVGAKTKILHKCLKNMCGYEWLITPSDALSGRGCPKCAGNLKLAHLEYIERLRKINPNIIPLENYTNNHTKVLHECLIDGYKWRAIPNSILMGEGCPKCGGTIKKNHNKYVSEVLLVNPDIEVIDRYVNATTRIRHKCKIDGYVWKAKPDNILHGYGCPQCKESSGERRIRQWLNSRSISYVYQKTFDGCKDKQVLPFDFYIPKYNLCIEFDGVQHFKAIDFSGKGKEIAKEKFEYTLKHDNIKNDYCRNNGISLLRIPYYKDVEEELNNFLFT